MHEARLDFVLESYARDNPEKLKFERMSTREARMHDMTARVQWSDVLSGRSLSAFLSRFVPRLPDAWKRPEGLRPGVIQSELTGPGAKDFADDKSDRK